ncbi:hypothetical protein [Kitasatospora sp. NPDC093806]|uniref:hypothetical protein n=1 Tax=Kitasatospora sp. NPDC093806 TaxID=3155075 RepID=UPI003445AA8B
MSGARMPVGLAPWAGSLSALSPELALALGPLLRRLDALVGTREPVPDAGPGDPEGLGGIGRSGRPDQLLPGEWLLAEEHPDEFLRRYVDGELLYLAPEFSTPTSRGRTVALVDAGPTQAGAGRLVQLAALLVLHRRAAARGSELLVGVLGDEPGAWLTGESAESAELAELLPAWLRSRRTADPTPEDVHRAATALDAADQAWLLTSPRLADLLSSGRPATLPRVLASEASRWGEAGATHVTVRLDHAALELPLPAGDIAVRALRGKEFRRSGPVVGTLPVSATTADAPGGLLPVFNSEATTLLMRGARQGMLLAVEVRDPDRRDVALVQPKQHRMNGPVIAAARIGRRLIALHLSRGRVLRYVSGRALGTPGEFAVDPAELGLDEALLAELADRPVLPLLRAGDDLLMPLAGRWRRFASDGTVTDDGPVAPGAEGPLHFDRFREPRLFGGVLPPETARARHLVHAGGAVAWSEDGKDWTALTKVGDERRIAFQDNAEVIGLVLDREEPVLITRSPGGRLVRAVRADGVRTLIGFSAPLAVPTVHPTLPLIAAETKPGRLVIGDPTTGRIHHMIGSAE